MKRGGEIVQLMGFKIASNIPYISGRDLETLEEFDAATDFETQRDTLTREDRAIGISDIEIDLRTGESERSHDIFDAVEAGILKAKIDRELDGVKAQVLVTYIIILPDLRFAEIADAAAIGILQAEIDTESDAGDHHLAHNAGIEAGAERSGEKILIPAIT